MKIGLKKIIFTAFCYLFLLNASAQSHLYTSLSSPQVAKDEYVAFRLVIENADKIEKIRAPLLQSFKVISGPVQETGTIEINGKSTQYVSFSYVLQPRRVGRITIGEATAILDGIKVKSAPLVLIVGKEQQAATREVNYKDLVVFDGETIQGKVAKSMQLRLQTDRTSCYVGEPIVATYKLYTRLKNDSRLAKNPSFNGFSVVDMPRPNENFYTKETLEGKEYNMLVIRKAQLYPLQPGDIDLETAEVDNDLVFLKDAGKDNLANATNLVNGGMVDPSLLIRQTVTISSKSITVHVKPLPEKGKPASFQGAVGDFHIESALAKTTFSTDETGMLAIRISGNGNLKLVTVPDFSWPDGLEPFEPKLTENMSYLTVPVSGEKIFTYSFSAQKEGEYRIPKIVFSYFDSQSGTYKKDSTVPIAFTVTKGSGVPVSAHLADQPKKEEASFLNSIFDHRWWIIVFVGIVIFCSLYYWLKKETEKEKLAEKIIAEDKARNEIQSVIETSALNQKNPLEESETCLYSEDCLQFYVLLNKEMRNFIAEKFKLDSSQVNSKTIAAAMDRSGIANETVLQLQQLMQEIEWYLYTPFVENDKRTATYSVAHDIIQEINNQKSC